MDNLELTHNASCAMVRARGSEDQLRPRGRFVIDHVRNGEVIGQYDISNAVTNQGKNKLLDVMFHEVTAIATWYILLINGTGTPTCVAGDTYAQINGSNGWTEFTTYSEATRLEWTEGAASNQAMTNLSPVVFDITGGTSVYGLAIVGGGTAAPTKTDAAGGGTLWAEAQFSSGSVTVQNGDQLKVTYTVNA